MQRWRISEQAGLLSCHIINNISKKVCCYVVPVHRRLARQRTFINSNHATTPLELPPVVSHHCPLLLHHSGGKAQKGYQGRSRRRGSLPGGWHNYCPLLLCCIIATLLPLHQIHRCRSSNAAPGSRRVARLQAEDGSERLKCGEGRDTTTCTTLCRLESSRVYCLGLVRIVL